MVAQALRDTLSGRGAKLGMIWIIFIAFLAVGGPFIANSFPFIAKRGGQIEFPLFRYLTPLDVTLVASAVTLPLLWWRMRRFTNWQRLLACAGWLGVTILILYSIVQPPKLTVFDTFRTAEKAGEIEWAIYAPIRFSPTDRLADTQDPSFLPPQRGHWFGTDRSGADVLSGMIHACRIAMSIGIISTGISKVIGILVGAVMGYFVGKTDLIGMRLIEVFEAIPTMFLLITFVAFYGRSLNAMMVIIGLTAWTGTARFVRAEFLRLRNQDFVQAAIALGLPLRLVMFRHMLPNGITPVLVTVSFGVASAILYESTLSFLGLGLVGEPSWGSMLEQARQSFNWWMAIFPGCAIFLTVFAYNLIGEALRDAFDPKLRKRE